MRNFLKKNDNRAAHARTTHVHLKLTIRNPRSYPKMASGITMDEALKQATAAGFPPLGYWKMMTPATVSVMVKKEIALRDTLDFVTPMELQVIYCVVSAANNCEMCLSFHSLGLKKGEAISDADLTVLRSGGIPETEFLANGHGRLKSIAFAAKYCIAHKGILLPRERKHLRKMGFDGPELAEITFCCGHIHANNMLMVSLIEQNCPVEETLRGVGPFGESGESTWWAD
jgi:AhpD family alkylhydroperoxidase